jgi:hypothetical protein
VIVRDGLATSVPVLFSSGHPDGDVSWRLLDATGAQLTSGAVTPSADAVSVNLKIDTAYNTLATGSYYSFRDFVWSYEVSGAVVNGEQRYTIEARPPFGASADGVRSKLGVSSQDLPDDDISLIASYLSFVSIVGQPAIDAVTDNGVNDLAMRDSIEAQAALYLIPTMAVRVAASEDSGTNAYKRQTVNWDAISDYLAGVVSNGILIAFPGYDPLANAGSIFIVATPGVDPVTGSEYTALTASG